MTDHGIQYANELPPWATLVVSRIERRSDGIIYEVLLQNEDAAIGNDIGEGREVTVWRREILFGAVDARSAGGYAFREAAREQDAVADRFAVGILCL